MFYTTITKEELEVVCFALLHEAIRENDPQRREICEKALERFMAHANPRLKTAIEIAVKFHT